MPTVTAAPDARGERHRRIIAATLVLLRQRPWPEVAMDDVARTAKVGKATLYRYFANKDALIGAAMAHVLADLDTRLADAALTPGAPPTRLRAIVAAMVETFASDLLPLRVLTRRDGELHVAWRRTVHDARNRLVAVLVRHFDEGVAAGAYRPLDRELTAHLAMGMIRSAVTHVEGRTAAQLVAAISELLLAACRAR